MNTHGEPAPDAPPTQPSTPAAAPAQPDALRIYNTVTDTVGGPSIRVKDNLIQAAIVIGATLLGAAAGYLWKGAIGAIAIGAGMMILSTLISGLVLMVLGWVRAARG